MKSLFSFLFVTLIACCACFTSQISGAAFAATLDDVKARGYLKCGVSQGIPGFSYRNEEGVYKGLDVDYCRALAAAIFDDPNAVKFTALSAQSRFSVLKSERIDVLSRNTTWTMTGDTSLGLEFIGAIYYDGQGFLVRKDLGVFSALDLSGRTICTQSGTTTSLNIVDYFTQNQLEYKIAAFENASDVVKAYDQGTCDVYTSDASQLYAMRMRLETPDDHMVLSDIISKEPLSPVVRQGDDQWINIARWTLNAIIIAEELDLSSGNLNAINIELASPRIRRFLGVDGNFGDSLGLNNEWAKNIIRHVGHYGEVFERNIGNRSDLKITRGLNALWSKGGILYAPPIR